MTPVFSFATLVTDWALYDGFVASARAAGFGEDCEFLTIDNTGDSQMDAYSGLNDMIVRAGGDIIILCHQDIELSFDNRAILEDRLSALTHVSPDWAVCGVAGIRPGGQRVMRITDRFGEDQCEGPFPAQVACLDECFIVLRKATAVRFSRDVSGFHLYGTDICLMAEALGYSTYAIDFHLAHLGQGNVGPDYHAAKTSFEKKWDKMFRDRYQRTTALPVFLSGRKEPGLMRRLRARIARTRQKRSPY